MPAPQITITAQVRDGRALEVDGWIAGSPTSATITILAATTPAGAVTVANVPIVVRANGYFSVRSTLSAGFYAGPVITATNADGTTTATGMPQQIYANGTAPPGHPVVLFPPRTLPTPSPTVALNGTITDFTLVNTSTSAQSSSPFTFGQAFKKGALGPNDFLRGDVVGGGSIPLQFNVKATHPDGSVRHGIISGMSPTLNAGESKTVNLIRTNSSSIAATAALASATASSGFTASVNLLIGGVSYVADPGPLLASNSPSAKVWIGGAFVTEHIVDIPLVDADEGLPHPLLTAQFCIRRYAESNAVRVTIAVENTNAYSPAMQDVTYSGTVKVGGQDVFVIRSTPAGTTLSQWQSTRWKRSFWWNNSNPVYVKHNRAYLQESMQVSNYDPRVTGAESVIAKNIVENIPSNPNYLPMSTGGLVSNMGTTGGRGDIGLAPSTYALYLVSMDYRAFSGMLAMADCGGSWSAHRRDRTGGPADGRPMNIIHWPRSTIVASSSDTLNVSTGQREAFYGVATGSNLVAESSHQPAFAYIPYLVTGDFYYLEELHFWCNYNMYRMNPGYRFNSRGIHSREQLRGQGWNMRTLAQAAAITPDDHPDKDSFKFWLDNNLAYYNNEYTDNPSSNTLGVAVNGVTVVYGADNALGPWQDDFFTQSIGHAAELGFTEAARLLRWKATFQVGRMVAPGVCWIHASIYSLYVRDTSTSPYYATLKECYDKALPELQAMPCNTPERLAKYIELSGNTRTVLGEMVGYAGINVGYPSNFQPALAMAVDSGYAEGDIAWSLYDSRTVKPPEDEAPQFAIVPRGYAPINSETPPPPDFYFGTAGASLTFGS